MCFNCCARFDFFDALAFNCCARFEFFDFFAGDFALPRARFRGGAAPLPWRVGSSFHTNAPAPPSPGLNLRTGTHLRPERREETAFVVDAAAFFFCCVFFFFDGDGDDAVAFAFVFGFVLVFVFSFGFGALLSDL
jgi:hypothetical protein